MIAELHNKISNSGSNLNEKSEDELTGNFFGCLRYMPFNKGLKKVFLECIRPKELVQYIEPLEVNEWSDKIEFWKRVLIGIEVKYLSGLSSEDEVDNSDGIEQISYNQLSREARALNHISNDKNKLLILLADELSCVQIYQNVQSRNIINGVEFGYISWQEVLIALRKIKYFTPYEQVIVNDMILLLEKKGFKRFESFEMDVIVDRNNWWSFTGTINIKFNFIIERDVEKGEYYEFG